MKQRGLGKLLKQLPECEKKILACRDIVLANLAMFAEIPAPTFGEKQRAEFLSQRFSEHGLQNPSVDEKGNAVGILPGQKEENRSILCVAHLDTIFPASVDHTITVTSDRITGPAVGDNSLGLAAVASLPQILDTLEIQLQSPLLLMGTASSLGRGNLDGLNFFLANQPMPIAAGLSIEGLYLGRLNINSVGMLRGEISCHVPEAYDWTRFGASGAIMIMHSVIDKLLAIPLPRKPRTAVVLGAISGGTSFNAVCHQASLRFEVRCDSSDMVGKIESRIEEICLEVASSTRAEVHFDIVARREPGGIEFGHPLVRCARRVMQALEIPMRMGPSTSELSAFIERRIPAITLGVTHGDNLNEPNETVMIDPIFKGLTQLVGILQVIDGGFCDEN